MSLRSRFEKIFLASEYNRNIAKVFTGSALSAIISLVALPIVTRLYAPEDLGRFQMLSAFIVLFATISSFKYELAIVLPKETRESHSLVVLSLVTLLGFTAAVAFFFLLFGEAILVFLNSAELVPYMALIPIGIFLGGCLQVLRFFLVVHKEFGRLSKFNVLQSFLNQSSAVGAGAVAPSFLGLILSQFAAQFVIILSILYRRRIGLKKIDWAELKTVAARYKKFPLVTMPTVFLNSISIQLPVFFIGKYLGPEAMGYYLLSSRLIDMPLNLFGSPVAQVYFKTASDAYQTSKEELLRIYRETVLKLAKAALVPALLLLIFAEEVVRIVSGDQWAVAALYVQLLMFAKLAQFVCSAVTVTVAIVNRQEIGFLVTVLFLSVRIVAYYLASYDELALIATISVVSGLFYVTYNVIIYRLVKTAPENAADLHSRGRKPGPDSLE